MVLNEFEQNIPNFQDSTLTLHGKVFLENTALERVKLTDLFTIEVEELFNLIKILKDSILEHKLANVQS